MAMGAALAFSAWLGLAALQGGPSIAGRVLDAQTGDPVAGAAIVVDGRTAGAAGTRPSGSRRAAAAESPRLAEPERRILNWAAGEAASYSFNPNHPTYGVR
jgi:hypothetical protein